MVPVYIYKVYIPSNDKLNSEHQESIDRQLADIRTIQEPAHDSNGLIREALMERSVAEREVEIAQSHANHAVFMERVNKERPRTIATLAGGWLVLCGLLYLVGLSFAWVGRGFRHKSSA
ncbi:hypothetical protein D9M68_947940 [compost metagenome]